MPTSLATAQHCRHLVHAYRRPGVILAVLLLLGAAARLRQYLAVTSYWHDEAYLLLNVFQKSFLELVGPLSHDQAAPPLFLWILRACYLALGPAELAMRLPALAASLAALALMAPLARQVVGGKGWLFAVGCAALSSSLLHLTYQVKPYTTDVLLAEVILLATVGCLGACVTGASPRWSLLAKTGSIGAALPQPPFLRNLIGYFWRAALQCHVAISYRQTAQVALVAAGVIGPWLSFPSVFVTGAACVALLCRALRSRPSDTAEAPPVPAAYAVALAMLLSVSCLALWLLAARYHNTDYQQSFWAANFVDISGPWAAIAWLSRKLVEAGNYGMHGTGIPLALLAAVGLAAGWRRRPSLTLVLVLPAALACVAAAGKHYPLGNRLLAFLLPCLWLLAAQGVDTVLRKFRRHASWVGAVPVLLLLPAAVYTARYSIFAKPSVEFRQALTYIHDQMREGDSLWVSQPEVHEVYFGAGRLLDVHSPDGALASAAERGRVWMLCHPPSSDTRLSQDTRRRFEALGALPILKRNFIHLDVTLFSPAHPLLAKRPSRVFRKR